MLKFNNISIVFSLATGIALFITSINSANASNDVQDMKIEHNHKSDTHSKIFQKLPEDKWIDLAGISFNLAKSKEFSPHCNGLFISYSTDAGGFAADGDGVNSPYTQALANLLIQPGMNLQKMAKEVRKKVIEDANSKQTGSSINQKPMYIDATSCEYQLTDKSDNRSRFALVIGNENYSSVAVLKNPGNDAQLIAPKLKELGFDVELMVDGDFKQMKAAIAKLKSRIMQTGNGSVAIIYYAGHGIEVNGRQYWIPVDVNMSNGNNGFDGVVDGLIPLNTLFNREIREKSLMVIFNDTVRTNPFSAQSR